jgi:putative SOS response-associated peptidase YedK
LPFKKSRCLVPASGFYEWKKLDETGKRKQPYHLGMRDQSVFAFAGLWTRWRSKEGGEPLDTCVIITTEPNELAATVHNRMPVIIAPEDYARRLDTFAPDATDLLRVLSRRKDGSVSRLDTRQFAEQRRRRNYRTGRSLKVPFRPKADVHLRRLERATIVS